MKLVRLAEYRYIKKHLRAVRHITLNPEGPGVIRVHMVPPKSCTNRAVPYVLILNGQDILPIGVSWAILLSEFIYAMEPFDGVELSESQWDELVKKAILGTKKIYAALTTVFLRRELRKMLRLFEAVAYGEKVRGEQKPISLQDYAPYMTAPHRMDLMVSAMRREGQWQCNQKCLHCYAARQPGGETEELTTAQWKQVLATLRRANIPQVTFTGGEPTLREDLVELVQAAAWFVTRLNTNGRLLSPALCRSLYEASLDSVQVTLYSSHREIHNRLIGAEGFDDTIEGIKNALAAGLNLSVNTPLCTLNEDYVETLEFVNSLGVKFVTCSGLIPSGNALDAASEQTKLGQAELKLLLQKAVSYCRQSGMELSFTSPGWLPAKELREIGILQEPTCGACLSNMAIAPDGTVVPCQSWLSGDGLGNILTQPWNSIWNSRQCRSIRAESAKLAGSCQLREGNRKEETV